MKETDLMIGDWVMFLIDVVGGDTEYDQPTEEYQPAKVHTISSWEVGGEVKNIDGVVNDPEQLQPIPLTAEILKKNGFEKVNGEYQDVFYCCDGLDLLIDDRLEPWCYTLYGVYELPIKYVHELQHALRLCGIEKEIKL